MNNLADNIGIPAVIDQSSPDFVTSFARGLSVICTFGAESRRQTLTEVAERSGLTRAAARRFLLTLCALGYARNDGKYFELSPQILQIGYSYLSSMSFTQTVQTFLRRVTDVLEESSSAAVLDGDEVVYVARSAARHRILSINLGVGARLPAHCTSMGHVLLGSLAEPDIEKFLRGATLTRFTEHTLTTRKALRERLEQVRAQGWAISDQELELGLRSLAVPLHDRHGNILAAMNVSVQATRVPRERLEAEYLPVLQDAARAFEETQRMQ